MEPLLNNKSQFTGFCYLYVNEAEDRSQRVWNSYWKKPHLYCFFINTTLLRYNSCAYATVDIGLKLIKPHYGCLIYMSNI
jgi:hypothetical protein